MNINHDKSVFAHQFFVRPADRNYVLARWCLFNGSAREYYWQASQALEKYLKAALLLNGLSVKKFRHEVVPLFENAQRIFGDLLPTEFAKPEGLHDDFWYNSSILKYCRLIDTYGGPDSRYGLISVSTEHHHVFHLDQLVRLIRRLTIGLDWVVGENWPVGDHERRWEGKRYQDVLEAEASFDPRSRNWFNDEFKSPRSLSPEETLRRGNFEFFPESATVAEGEDIGFVSAGINENSHLFILYRGLVATKKTSKAQRTLSQKKTILVVTWLLDNVKFSRDAENEIRRVLKS